MARWRTGWERRVLGCRSGRVRARPWACRTSVAPRGLRRPSKKVRSGVHRTASRLRRARGGRCSLRRRRSWTRPRRRATRASGSRTCSSRRRKATRYLCERVEGIRDALWRARGREERRTAAYLEQIAVADDHGLLEAVDDDGVLLDDVVRAEDDGPADGEDRAARMEDRSCAQAVGVSSATARRRADRR